MLRFQFAVPLHFRKLLGVCGCSQCCFPELVFVCEFLLASMRAPWWRMGPLVEDGHPYLVNMTLPNLTPPLPSVAQSSP